MAFTGEPMLMDPANSIQVSNMQYDGRNRNLVKWF